MDKKTDILKSIYKLNENSLTNYTKQFK